MPTQFCGFYAPLYRQFRIIIGDNPTQLYSFTWARENVAIAAWKTRWATTKENRHVEAKAPARTNTKRLITYRIRYRELCEVVRARWRRVGDRCHNMFTMDALNGKIIYDIFVGKQEYVSTCLLKWKEDTLPTLLRYSHIKWFIIAWKLSYLGAIRYFYILKNELRYVCTPKI